jgi:hypothetical protein
LVKKTLFAALWLLIALAPASADVLIKSSPGGDVGEYLQLFALVRQSGQRVVIDGPCLSACTLVLSIVPQSRICMTRRAILGFHAALEVDRRGRLYPATDATRVIAATYPAPIQAWIARHGGLSHRLILLRGPELMAMYSACSAPILKVSRGSPHSRRQ